MEALQKEDGSPFKLGHVQAATHCLALESPLFRAAAAAHLPPASDFLLVRFWHLGSLGTVQGVRLQPMVSEQGCCC